jgi:predicted transcriptional regulator
LSKKGILKSTRIGRAFHYEACITEKEYRSYETKQFVNDVHKGSIFGFVSALCDNGDLTREDIEALMERLKER